VEGEAEAMAARLRTGEPSVLGRIEDGRLVLDVRCIEDRDLGRLAAAVVAAREPLPGASVGPSTRIQPGDAADT